MLDLYSGVYLLHTLAANMAGVVKMAAADASADASYDRASEEVHLNKDTSADASDSLIDLYEHCTRAEPTEEELLGDYFDSMVGAVCDSPSIYTLVWISRSWRPDYSLAFFLSLAIQVYLPTVLLNRRWNILKNCEVSLPRYAFEGEVKTACALFSLFLASTFTGTLKRALGMGYLAAVMPGRTFSKVLGSLAVIACIWMTCLNTVILFVESPDLEDILLNCIALNFLPDADTTLSFILEILHNGAYQHTKYRLNVFQEAFPKSKARVVGLDFWKMGFVDQVKARPFFSLLRILEVITKVFLAILPVALWFLVNRGDMDEHED